jgi:hypothetical protein
LGEALISVCAQALKAQQSSTGCYSGTFLCISTLETQQNRFDENFYQISRIYMQLLHAEWNTDEYSTICIATFLAAFGVGGFHMFSMRKES